MIYPFYLWNVNVDSKLCFESEDFALSKIYPLIRWSSWDIAKSVENAFIRNGIEILSFKPIDDAEKFEEEKKLSEKFLYVKFNRKYTTYHIFENIFSKINQNKLKLVLFIHGANIPILFIKKLKFNGIKTAVWLLDDPHEIDQSKKYSHYYDYVFTIEKNAVPIHLRKNNKVYYLPPGYDDEIFYPQKDDRYESDICIIGSAFPERVNVLEKIYPYIKDLKIRIVGNWEFNKDSSLRKLVEHKFVPPNIASKYYSNAKIVLNHHRMSYSSSSLGSNVNRVEGISPNPRLFESSACGAFSIVNEERRGCFSFFEKGREIDSFSNADELIFKIRYWINNSKLREDAQKKILEKNVRNTYVNRVKEIINICLN
ncbi:MAG: glycosyltransferase [Elusimicrobiales bacterium]|nr:glycosyltransferase [Elusimicrobiales bacterium]